MAIDETGGRRGQENGRAHQFLYIAPAPCGGTGFQPCGKLRVVDQRFIERRVEISRCDCIALQPVFGPIGGHAFGQIAHGAFGGGVGRDARAGQRCLHGGDVDDFAVPAFDHVVGDGLADVKDGGNIGAQQLLERVGGEVFKLRPVLHACVVDQDIDGACACLKRIDCRFHGGMVGRIKGDLMGITKRLGRFGQFAGVAAIEDDVRTCLLQAFGQRVADALARSGDQGAFAGEVEKVCAGAQKMFQSTLFIRS